MTLRVGLIGAGVMGADHARILAADIPGATLQVVCDADGPRARAVADATGAAHVLTDADAVIARSDVDAVLIASPDATHAPLALAAIAARKPALVEKPLAPEAAACRAILEAEAAAGRRLVTAGFMRRFDPSYAAMRQGFEQGAIGAALMFHCLHRNVAAPDWFTPAMAITNSAPHEFDIARFVLGSEPVAITAHQPRRGGGRVAPVFMVIETDAGQLVTIEINNEAAYGYDVRGELVGERGTLSLRAPVEATLRLDLSRSEAYPADWRPRFADAYRLQNRDWVESVTRGVPSRRAASTFDGLVATLVGEAGVTALEQGTRVPIAVPPRPALFAPDA